MQQTDSLGRATFHHIPKRPGVRPTPREIRWLKHIERHGPQSSLYLHELTKDTHRCPDTTRRQLQKLRAGGFLHCPKQQRYVENASFNPYIYDLTQNAKRFMVDEGIAENTVRPTGHWQHLYMTACVTSSIDIQAAWVGTKYIPAHKILERSGATLGAMVDGRKLIPDALFGLDYGGLYRFFCVEVDRGTEPISSRSRRKSWTNMLEQYDRFIRGGLYKRHYGLTAPMLLHCVFVSYEYEMRFMKLVAQVLSEQSSFILPQTVVGFEGSLVPSKHV